MKQLKQFLQDRTIESLLDVGTGSGDFIKVLKEALPKIQITGVDPNPDSLALARQNYPEFNFLEMPGENLDFADNTFQAASISMALHHLPDVQKTLSEMKRVVQAGGWIIISELFSDNLNDAQKVHKLFHHFRSTIDHLIGVNHFETFKKNEIIALVEKSGIDIQLQFEFNQGKNMIEKPEDIEQRVEKMKLMLEQIKNLPEYDLLVPQIEEFKAKVTKYGFQPATRIVIVGQVVKK
jgi:ubiquinone/menaquinone biosynthesis C-methylase UbiE